MAMQVIKMMDLNSQYGDNALGQIAYNTDAVNGLFVNLLYTTKGELSYEPNFGTRLEYMLHSPCNEKTAWEMRGEVIEAINTWMKGIVIVDYSKLRVAPFPEKQMMLIEIQYQHIATGISGTYRSAVNMQV